LISASDRTLVIFLVNVGIRRGTSSNFHLYLDRRVLSHQEGSVQASKALRRYRA